MRGLFAEWRSDWSAPFPFRALVLESEHDAELGQWMVTVAALGLAVTLTWVYAETELRKELAERFADDSWLEGSTVTMSYADYRALQADAEKWRESQQ